MKTLFAVLLSAFLVACAAPPQPLATLSGRPEKVFTGLTKKQVTDAIVASALSRGSQVKSVSEYSVVLARRADNSMAAQILFGSSYDSVPEARVTLNLVDVPGGVQVYGRGEMITNPGSAYERVTPLPGGDADIQKSLDDIARRIGQ